MAVKIYKDLVQGSDEWLAARCGILTASEMKLIITPTLKVASNEKERAHLYELLAQRITGYAAPGYISEDMIRGKEDEVFARIAYSDNYAPVSEVGFIVNDDLGFQIGYSPDGLVGEDGAIECKSRKPKYQIETILGNEVPGEYMIQIQTGLFVSGRKWCDFISYSAGLPMITIRVFPDEKVIDAISKAAIEFERRISEKLDEYASILASGARLIPTERRVEQEIWA